MASRALVLALSGAAVASSPALAQAEEWIYQDDDIDARALAIVRFSGHVDLWVSTFERPPRACDAGSIGFSPRVPMRAVRALRTTQLFPPGTGTLGGFCSSSASDEIGIGAGVEVAFRIASPLYVTAGVDAVYTTPESPQLKNQAILSAPFGVLLTNYAWSLRPIAHAKIMPILYLTDDARDYTLGFDLGFAARILDWGDASFTVGYKTAETITSWQIELALHPLP